MRGADGPDSGVDDALLGAFDAEAETRLALLDAAEATKDQARLEVLRREAHTLKGTASVLELEVVAAIAGRIEDRLAAAVAAGALAGEDAIAVRSDAAALRATLAARGR